MLSHIFFADDSLVFFRADKQDCEKLKSYLTCYEKASGQLINYDRVLSLLVLLLMLKVRRLLNRSYTFRSLMSISYIWGSQPFR